jgi:hypothetical protein
LIRDDPDLGWADEFRAGVLGDSTDYLAGALTIGELDEGALRLLGWLAAARERYATYLIDQLSAPRAVPFPVWEAGQQQSSG